MFICTQLAALFTSPDLVHLFKTDIDPADWDAAILENAFGRLAALIPDGLSLPRWQDLPLRQVTRQVGRSLLVQIAPGHWRCITILYDTGVSRYDPATSLLLRQLNLVAELKSELARRLADELRPRDDEKSMSAFFACVEETAGALGLTAGADRLRQLAEERLKAVWSLRASSAEDRAVGTAVMARMDLQEETRGWAEVEDDIRYERAEAWAERMSETIQR